MKDRFICTNQHHTTVHLYLYLYLNLYVQCNAVAVTVAPFFLLFYTGERREQCKGFQKSLEQLRDTGVQPRQGEVQVHGGLNAWWQTHTESFTQEK